MLNHVIAGFKVEMEKVADLISKELFKALPDYQKQRLVEARDVIEEATKKGTKVPRNIREKMLEAAFDNLKGTSYGMVDALNNPGNGKTECVPCSIEKPKKEIKSL